MYNPVLYDLSETTEINSRESKVKPIKRKSRLAH